VECQVRKGTAAAPKFSRCALGHIEKVAFGEQMLPTIDLQESLTLQDHTGDIYLRIDVQGYTFAIIKSQEIAVQVWALQGENWAVDSGTGVHVK
jgi:hypothetical protein